MNRNLFFICFFIFLWFFSLFIGFVYYQIIKYDYYYKRSLHLEKIKIPSRRGSIYDRRGNILAGSFLDYSGIVAIDAKNNEYNLEDLKEIKGILKIEDSEILKAINSKNGFYILKNNASVEELKKLEKISLKGLILDKKYKRVSLYEEFLSHLIGWVDFKGDGINGLELYYNEVLKGKDGYNLVLRDSHRVAYDLGEEIEPLILGKDIKTSIDVSIQYEAYKTLKNLREEISYEWGAISIINPQNGEIIAHSIYPPFEKEMASKWQDEHLASSYYEPGSILKPFFAETALRLNLIDLNKKFDCSKGYVEINGIKIEDHKRFEEILNFDETLYFSSNVGCILWSREIPRKEFLKTLEEYGFFSKTGIDLKPEVYGRFPYSFENFNELNQAYVTLGQGISVTSAQILRAYSALINGGYLIVPKFAKSNVKRKKLSFKPSYDELKTILYQTVIKGTGKKAYLPFQSLGGKTGTAQVAEKGRYIEGKYISSFVCWFPLEEPKYLILTVIKKPKPYFYASEVAVPLAKNIVFFLFLRGHSSEIV